MKKSYVIIALFLGLSTFSCKKDDVVSCTTCNSLDTLSFELCKETDGNASINGQNTGTPYETYLNNLQDTGVECGL